MRPICSGIGSPVHDTAKWLSKEFAKFEQPIGLYVKNSYEFIDKTRNITIPEDYIQASIDIDNMYNSIPVIEAEKSIENWLKSLNTLNDLKVSEYMHLVHLCFSKNYIQFNNNVYEQISGLAMGNPLAAFAANCFMADFETNVKKNFSDFPILWIRYVDDTYIIIHKDKLQMFLNFLNNVMPGIIKFTFEKEIDFCLPFLDIMVKRIENHVEFDIYRKSTSTDRCITSNSYHPKQTKFAALNSFCYRAIQIPLSEQNYKNEVKNIYRIAEVNGYNKNIVNSLLKKHKVKKDLKNLTSLTPSIDNPFIYISSSFVEGLTYSLGKIFKKYFIKLAPNSSRNKVKNLIGTIKDKTETIEKSGIYSVICQNCDEVYIGQTRRSVKTRWSEHYKSIYSKTLNESTPADHMIHNNHVIAGFRLLKQINKPKLLDAYEEIYINRTKNMNKNKTFDRSLLHKFLVPLSTKQIFEKKF